MPEPTTPNGQPAPVTRPKLTAAEKRLLDAIRRSAEAYGKPWFDMAYAGGRYVKTGRKMTEVGTIHESVQYRHATLVGLREKGYLKGWELAGD